MDDKIKIPIKAALAALSQKATHQADIDYAKQLLSDALEVIAGMPVHPEQEMKNMALRIVREAKAEEAAQDAAEGCDGR